MRAVPCIALLLLAACDGEPPAWCEAKEDLTLPCAADDDCVVGVVVDYQRLEPRGWIARKLTQKNPVAATAAEALALDHVTKVLGAARPTSVDSDRAGDFFNCFLSYDPADTKDTWFVVIHAYSGEVVFAEKEVWADADRGYDPPLPAGWQGATALGCTDGATEPQSKALRTTGTPVGSEPASTPSEAWDVAKRLNLVDRFTQDKTYRVMVVSYSTDVGEFDPPSADWYVWITRD